MTETLDFDLVSLSDEPKVGGKRRRVFASLFLLGGVAVAAVLLIPSASKADVSQESALAEIDNTSTCGRTNYIVQDRQIFAQPMDGSESIRINFKGVNWFGLEGENAALFGMNYTRDEQSTLSTIVQDLVSNNFNAVRLPIAVDGILDLAVPNIDYFINTTANPTLNVSKYLDLVVAIVKELATHQIGVMLDFHQLQHNKSRHDDQLWYNSQISELQVGEAIDLLADTFCTGEFYNVVGIDLKNEPHGTACWGPTSTCPYLNNWHLGASRLANRAAWRCDSWLIFVEGYGYPNVVNGKRLSYRNETINGRGPYVFSDWWGSTFDNLDQFPLISEPTRNLDAKVVYTPHFYSPSVFPAKYFFQPGTFEVPYPNDPIGNTALKENFYHIMRLAIQNALEKGPVVFGEFGGIYGTEDHGLMKTSTRVIDYMLDFILENNLPGGFMWSLNPDSGFGWNGEAGTDLESIPYGLYLPNWRGFRQDYLQALQRLDQMQGGINFMPCFPIE